MENGTDGPLTEFWQFAKDFKSVWAWIGKAAVAAPLTDILLNVGPPWPSRIGVALLVCIAEVLVLMYSFEFWKQGAPSQLGVRQVMKGGLLCTAIVFVGYMFLFAHFIVDADDAWHREVIGYRFNAEAEQLIASNPSTYTPENLLEEFERNPTNVWTPASVKTMRVVMLLVWLLFWISLSCVVAAFIALQWRHLSDKQKRGKKTVQRLAATDE